MKKIKDYIVQALYKNKLTKKQLMVMLYLLERCDERGELTLYYKDLMKTADLSRYVYTVLKELSEEQYIIEIKGENETDKIKTPLISMEKSAEYKSEIKVKILYNDFTDEELPTAYTCLDLAGLDTKTLNKLSGVAIRIALYGVFRITKSGYYGNSDNGEGKRNKKGKLEYSKSETFTKIASQLNTEVRTIKRCLAELIKSKIAVYGKGCCERKGVSYDVLTFNKWFLQKTTHTITEHGKKEQREATEHHNEYLHNIKNICRRERLDIDFNESEDIAVLMTQYSNKAVESGYTSIINVITQAIRKAGERAGNVLATSVHTILKSMLDKNYLKRKMLLSD